MRFYSKIPVTRRNSLVLFMGIAYLCDAWLDLGYFILSIHLSKCNNADIFVHKVSLEQ